MTRPCEHVHRAGIVSNAPPGTIPPGAHMSRVVCERVACIDDAIARVEEFTRQTAQFYADADRGLTVPAPRDALQGSLFEAR